MRYFLNKFKDTLDVLTNKTVWIFESLVKTFFHFYTEHALYEDWLLLCNLLKYNYEVGVIGVIDYCTLQDFEQQNILSDCSGEVGTLESKR